VETIEAIRLIKGAIPHVKTVLGISNISFGLPPAAREVVNSVFLYYCTKAGLDLAIVNAEKLERFASIPEEERRLAENLLFNTPPCRNAGRSQGPRGDAGRRGLAGATREQKVAINQFHIAAIAEHFRKAAPKRPGRGRSCRSISAWPTTSSKESKDGLIEDLDRKLPKAPRRSTSSTAR
jgi:5-methyltetrahydrofolate--homocysteine methyltransferase